MTSSDRTQQREWSDQLSDLLKKMQHDIDSTFKKEDRWVALAERLLPRLPQDVQTLVRRDLWDRKLMNSFRVKFTDQTQQHVFILQSTPPSIVGIECKCAYPLCPRGVTPPESFRLSLEPCSNLDYERVPVLPQEPKPGSTRSYRGKGKKRQVWFCLECVESIYNRAYATDAEDFRSQILEALSTQNVKKLQNGPVALSSGATNGTSLTFNNPLEKTLTVKIKPPKLTQFKPSTLCGSCHEPAGRKVLVACQSKPSCSHGTWFDLKCANLKKRPSPSTLWRCPKCVKGGDNASAGLTVFQAQLPARFVQNSYAAADDSDASTQDGVLAYSNKNLSEVYPPPLKPRIPGQTGLMQIASMIYPEVRDHDTEFFTLTCPQQHALWIWKTTITRQVLFDCPKNLQWLTNERLLYRFNAPAIWACEEYPDMCEVDNEPVGVDDSQPVRGFMNYGGYLVELDADEVRNTDLGAVMKESDSRVNAITDRLRKEGGVELLEPKPYVWSMVRFSVKREVVEEEVVQKEGSSSSDDGYESSNWSDF